jgi:hypothetical protein
MDLRHRRRRQGLIVERREEFLDGLAEGLLHELTRFGSRKWRNLILQQRELVCQFLGEQIAARGQKLAELDEYGSERFHRKA